MRIWRCGAGLRAWRMMLPEYRWPEPHWYFEHLRWKAGAPLGGRHGFFQSYRRGFVRARVCRAQSVALRTSATICDASRYLRGLKLHTASSPPSVPRAVARRGTDPTRHPVAGRCRRARKPEFHGRARIRREQSRRDPGRRRRRPTELCSWSHRGSTPGWLASPSSWTSDPAPHGPRVKPPSRRAGRSRRQA